MKRHTDEVRLTAYLLGELNEPEEIEEFESALQASADLQMQAEEMQRLETSLISAFQVESFETIAFPSFQEMGDREFLTLGQKPIRFSWLPWASGLAASLGLVACLFLLSSKVELPHSGTSLTREKVSETDSDKRSQTEMRLKNQKPLLTGSAEISSYPSISQSIALVTPDSVFLETSATIPLRERSFSNAWNDPLSGFPVFFDARGLAEMQASFDNAKLPSPGDVRIDSLVNAFAYNYVPPKSPDETFAVHLEQATSPWVNGHTLLRVGVKGYEVPWLGQPDNNLVFLVDVSGSMDEANKLPLIKTGLQKLVDELRPQDRIAIVTYGASSEVILPSTMVLRKSFIEETISQLQPGGSTLALAGIVEAYRIAADKFIEGGNNRIIVCTDGDLSLGASDNVMVRKLVAEQANRGVLLSAYGFAMDTIRNYPMEDLSALGGGQFAYIDAPTDLDSFFVDQVSGKTITIANDVRVEVEFNPRRVDAYRLIGYESESPPAQSAVPEVRPQFAEVVAGQAVTALYELIPADLAEDPKVQGEENLSKPTPGASSEATELVTVRVHYQPEGRSATELIEVLFSEDAVPFEDATSDLQFAAAVTGFGQLLRNSRYKGDVTYDWILSTVQNALGYDPGGNRAQFMEIVKEAEEISNAGYSAAEN